MEGMLRMKIADEVEGCAGGNGWLLAFGFVIDFDLKIKARNKLTLWECQAEGSNGC